MTKQGPKAEAGEQVRSCSS